MGIDNCGISSVSTQCLSLTTGRRGGRSMTGQMVIDHDEDNLSDKETYSKNIPAIGKKVY